MSDDQPTFDDFVEEMRAEGTQGPATDTRSMSKTERFQAFHRDNPAFYDHLVTLARRYLLRTGANKVGIQRLIEIARWDLEIQTGGMDFKINNDFGAFYARLIAHREPDLVDAFTMRQAREADEWVAGLREAA